MESFWQAFFEHSLKTHWFIGPVYQSSPSMQNSLEIDSSLSSLGPSTVERVISNAETRKSPVKDKVKKIATEAPKIFLLGHPPGDPQLELMVQKMIKAIGETEKSVFCSWQTEPYRASQLSELSSEQKVILFGKKSFRGLLSTEYGTWFPLGPNKSSAMLTLSLQDLKTNGKLKRQTWEHLQSFSGIS